MKKQLTLLPALCLSLVALNSCSEEEDPSTQNPSTQNPSTMDSSTEEMPTSRKSTPAQRPESGSTAEKTSPAAEPDSADLEAPQEAPDSNPVTPAPAAPTGKTAPPAVAAFMTELSDKGILRLARKMERREEGEDRNPLAMLDMFRDLNDLRDKLETVNTDGLPEDLKTSAEQFRNAAANLADHVEESPIPVEIMTAGQEAMGEWFTEKMAADPLFLQSMQDWGRTMGELGGAMEKAGTDWANSLAEYGIEPPAE